VYRADRDRPLLSYDDEVITAHEVAAILRMTAAWVYAETRRNRIPHMRLGRYVRYRRSAIEAWMATLEGEGLRGASFDHPRSDAPAERALRRAR
jgi:excisionase family DNA binding protein